MCCSAITARRKTCCNLLVCCSDQRSAGRFPGQFAARESRLPRRVRRVCREDLAIAIPSAKVGKNAGVRGVSCRGPGPARHACFCCHRPCAGVSVGAWRRCVTPPPSSEMARSAACPASASCPSRPTCARRSRERRRAPARTRRASAVGASTPKRSSRRRRLVRGFARRHRRRRARGRSGGRARRRLRRRRRRRRGRPRWGGGRGRQSGRQRPHGDGDVGHAHALGRRGLAPEQREGGGRDAGSDHGTARDQPDGVEQWPARAARRRLKLPVCAGERMAAPITGAERAASRQQAATVRTTGFHAIPPETCPRRARREATDPTVATGPNKRSLTELTAFQRLGRHTFRAFHGAERAFGACEGRRCPTDKRNAAAHRSRAACPLRCTRARRGRSYSALCRPPSGTTSTWSNNCSVPPSPGCHVADPDAAPPVAQTAAEPRRMCLRLRASRPVAP